MKEITQKETSEIVEENEDEIKKIINNGGKVITTIIYEKDKVTTIKKIEPANGKTTSSKIIQTKDNIINCF